MASNYRKRKRRPGLHGAVHGLIILALLTGAVCLFASSCGRQEDPKTPERETEPAPEAAANYSADAPPVPQKEPPLSSANNKVLEAFNSGRRLLAMKEPKIEDAEEKFTLAIKHDENYGPAYFQRGMCRRLLGKTEEALNDLLKAVELLPEEPEPLFHAAWTLLDMGRLDEARTRFQTLAERFPENPRSYYFLGAIAERQRDLPCALKQFNAALSRDPDHVQSLMEKSCLHAIFGEFDKSLKDIERLKKEQADDPRCSYLESNIYLMRGRWRMDRASRPEVKGGERERLAGDAAEDFRKAVWILKGLLADRRAPVYWRIARAEAVASQSNADEQLYSAAAKEFETILEEIRAEIFGEGARALWVFVPRLHRDLAVVKMAAGGESARNKAVDHLKEAVSFADELPELWACDGVSAIDKWLGYRAVCDSMRGLVKILVSSKKDYAEARKYLEKLLEFQVAVNADHGPAAAERKRERENVREAIYECEFQEMAPSESAKYTYDQCVEFLAHPYYKFRVAGLICLGKGDDPKCRGHIIKALDDPDERVAMLAMEFIKEKGIRAAAPKLSALTADSDTELALAAAACLGKLLKQCATAAGDIIVSDETRIGIPALIKGLESDEVFVREAAIEALGEVTGRTLMYHHDDPPERRARAVERWREWWKKTASGRQEAE